MYNIINQLINIYYEKETWHRSKLPEEEAQKYFKHLMNKGQIIYYTDYDKVIGYIEFWRINLIQLVKILSGDFFSAYQENISDGYICYVANIWIDDRYNNSDTYRLLKNRLFNLNKDCMYFVGQDTRHKRLRVHRRFYG